MISISLSVASLRSGLVGVVILGGFSIHMANAVTITEMQALTVLAKNAPAIASAINADPTLSSTVGAKKWPLALKRLAEFSQNTNPDFKEALRIIGDAVPRSKSHIGNIQIDGNPSEWSESIPPVDFVRRRQGSARDVWEQGAAAVVREDHLYLMIGLANVADYLRPPTSEVRVLLDCKDDQAWDVCLSLTLINGRWVGKQGVYGANWSEARPLPSLRGAVAAVGEVCIDIRDFVKITKAKPIWTAQFMAKTKGTGRDKYRTQDIPVFNENAREGVAAWPYMRTFLCLCSDESLEDFGLTAAAIAIMSSTMYMDSNEEVHRKIRMDNAEFLELARSIDAWQVESGAEFRLKDYPLEAQLAWAARIRNDIDEFLITSREPGNKNNLENYKWASTSVETLKRLKTVAVKERLADTSLGKCSGLIDRWVGDKQEYSLYPGEYRKGAMKATDSEKAKRYEEQAIHAEQLVANADVVGSCKGKPVSTFKIRHSETILDEIEKHGRSVGSCGHHTQLCADFMRALGIAPIRFAVVASREDLTDHTWPGRYDPSGKVWRAYQAGRQGKAWWFFFLPRLPVFSYATETEQIKMNKTYQGPRPSPQFFCRELQGFQVKAISQDGIPTEEVREWMLTSGF